MSFLREIVAHKIRFIKTCVLCLSFTALGISGSLIGPCLLDFRQAVQASQEEINFIFLFSSGGYVIGSLILGVFAKRFNTQIAFGSALLFTTACLFGLPWNRTLYGLIATNFAMQIAGGVIDCIGNSWVFRLWGKFNGPFNQALHMSWGIGAFISPLVAAPFLSEKSVTNATQNESDNNEIDIDFDINDLRIQWAYTIAGIICLVCVSLVFIMFLIQRSDKPHPSKIEGDKTRTKLSKRQKVKILLLTTLLLHSHCSIEITIGRLLTPFSVFCDLRLSKVMGAYITAIYWGTFTFSRVFTIFIIALIGPKWMLWIDFTIVIIANAILIPFGQVYELGLIIGVALLGLGISSIFPTLFALTEEFIPVTPRISALFLVVGVSGELTLPVVSGYFIETFPMLFIYMASIASVISFTLYAILSFVTKNINK